MLNVARRHPNLNLFESFWKFLKVFETFKSFSEHFGNFWKNWKLLKTFENFRKHFDTFLPAGRRARQADGRTVAVGGSSTLDACGDCGWVLGTVS
jgi:hypothetical protein